MTASVSHAAGASFVDAVTHRLVPAVPVPFTTKGQIDEPMQATYVAWMATQPVGAVAVWAHTGRGLLLSDEQRARVLAAWRIGAPHVPIVCGVGVPRAVQLPTDPRARTDAVIDHAARMAHAGRQGGAGALLVYPPGPLRDLPDADGRVVALHEAVAGAGLPVLAFHLYEAASGLAYPATTVERVLAVDGVVGIKVATLDSVMQYQELAWVVERAGRLLVTGEDRFLGYSMMLGAQAALVGIGAALTDRAAALLDAWFGGSIERFVALSRALDAFAAATFVEPMEGYVQRMLWALAADGVLSGDPSDPFGPALARDARARVGRAVRALRAA